MALFFPDIQTCTHTQTEFGFKLSSSVAVVLTVFVSSDEFFSSLQTRTPHLQVRQFLNYTPRNRKSTNCNEQKKATSTKSIRHGLTTIVRMVGKPTLILQVFTVYTKQAKNQPLLL